MRPSSASPSQTPPYTPHTHPQHRHYIPSYSQPQLQHYVHDTQQDQVNHSTQQLGHTVHHLSTSSELQNRQSFHSHAFSNRNGISHPQSSSSPRVEKNHTSFVSSQSLQLQHQDHTQRNPQNLAHAAPSKTHYFTHASPDDIYQSHDPSQNQPQQSLRGTLIRPSPTYFSSPLLHNSDHTQILPASGPTRSNIHSGEIAPSPAPPCTLSKQDVAILSQTYADTLSLLRKYLVASQWLLHTWALTSQPVVPNVMNLDFRRCRGFRTLYVCGDQSCASFESPCVLQKSATLLVPMQTNDPLIFGYFVDSSVDRMQSASPRVGKYVYCTDTQQLVKVSRVPYHSSSTPSSTILIQKMALVSRTMVVNDFVMASFPHIDERNYQPLSQYVVHSRTLSFHTLVQSAQRAGFLGYADDVRTLSSSDEERYQDIGVLENSFYGVGTFGVYDGSIVPCKFPPGARGDDYTSFTPQPAYGVWAAPEHLSVCRGMQMIHLGLSREEGSVLKAQFVQAVGQSSPRTNILSSNVVSQAYHSSHLEEVALNQVQQQCLNGREDGPGMNFSSKHHQDLYVGRFNERANIRQSLSEVPMQSTTPMTVMFEAQELDDGGLSDEKESLEEDHGAEMKEKQVTPIDLNREFNRSGGCTVENVLDPDVANHPPIEDTIEAVVSVGRNFPEPTSLGKRIAKLTSTPPATQNTTSTHFKSYAPVSAPELIPTPAKAPLRLSTPITTVLPTPVQVAVATPAGTADVSRPSSGLVRGIAPAGFSASMDDTTEKEESPKPSSNLVKKTLPAPTKSEIVIRNRISAQRSNEKRRRKIEATKCELAYLKTTYLPQLEHRRIALATENHSLRLSFMQKYHENVETFF